MRKAPRNSKSPLTMTEHAIMEALAVYRYLTSRQMVRLGISASEKSLNDNNLSILRRRSRPAYIKTIDFGSHLGYGKTYLVYCLDDAGARLVEDDLGLAPGSARVPKTKGDWIKDYEHRLALIDTHISFRQWARNAGAKMEISCFDFDRFRPIPNSELTKETTVEWQSDTGRTVIVPDGVLGLSFGEQQLLYALEIHVTPHKKRISEQLLLHHEAMRHEAIPKRFNANVANFVLTVHKDAANMERVKHKLRDTPELNTYRNAFFFNTIEQVINDFTTGWTLVDGSACEPFPRPY